MRIDVPAESSWNMSGLDVSKRLDAKLVPARHADAGVSTLVGDAGLEPPVGAAFEGPPPPLLLLQLLLLEPATCFFHQVDGFYGSTWVAKVRFLKKFYVLLCISSFTKFPQLARVLRGFIRLDVVGK